MFESKIICVLVRYIANTIAPHIGLRFDDFRHNFFIHSHPFLISPPDKHDRKSYSNSICKATLILHAYTIFWSTGSLVFHLFSSLSFSVVHFYLVPFHSMRFHFQEISTERFFRKHFEVQLLFCNFVFDLIPALLIVLFFTQWELCLKFLKLQS